MGILAPLYLAGLAALSLPLILHLIRRTPRGRQVFSSLMFLTPSPPRLTRRSRLDHLLLLAMRLGILTLLALAFARPFLRESALLSLDALPSRKVALLIDTSASMRRSDLWQQAVRKADEVLSDLGPRDQVALYTFDDRLQAVVRFDSDPTQRTATQVELVRSSLRKLSPGWAGSNLGEALVAVAGELDAATDVAQSVAEPQIVLISDFQKGSRIEDLQAFEWPKRVRVVAHTVASSRPTNAFAHLLQSEEDADDEGLRVRVVNAADSVGDQFYVSWNDARPNAEPQEVAVYVPPGQSRVVRLPRPDDNPLADRIVLRGDDHDFDNTHYVVPPRKQNVTVHYLGQDAETDPHGLRYYLQLALSEDPIRQVTVQPFDPKSIEFDSRSSLVVASQRISADVQASLSAFLQNGGSLVLVPKDRDAATSLTAFFDDVQLREPAASERPEYLLLGEIDFTHPLFAPFANPRYSDFTKIHFWQHRPVVVNESAVTHVIARFDNGDPALLERSIGKGRVLALTSGWSPDDSQLALSSKFVPLIHGILDQAVGTTRPLASGTVGESVALNSGADASRVVVHMPDGREVDYKPEAPAPGVDEKNPVLALRAEVPGIYRARTESNEWAFAVNLNHSESNTAPLELEQLEQLGVPFGVELTRAERLDIIRQQRDTELEGRQKIWRWLIVAALGVAILETWWAARAARQAAQPMEVVA